MSTQTEPVDADLSLGRPRVCHRTCCEATGHPGPHTTFCGLVRNSTPSKAPPTNSQACVVCEDLTNDPRACPNYDVCRRWSDA